MEVSLKPGKYVVAVSGGVDSTALLHLLSTTYHLPPTKFVVAHYDHGIRQDSADDKRFVERLARKYELEFYCGKGELGPNASEALARQKRYEFLRRIKLETRSSAILTAHHQDDLIETVVFNLLRGTGRKGLTPLESSPDVKRPLLGVAKQDLLDYALAEKLTWRDDPTNQHLQYSRNFIRHRIITKLSGGKRKELLKIIKRTKQINQEIDTELASLLDTYSSKHQLSRSWFIMLPHDVSREVLIAWLRKNNAKSNLSDKIESLVIQAKVLRPSQSIDVDKSHRLHIGKRWLELISK